MTEVQNITLPEITQEEYLQQIKDYLPQWLYSRNRMLSDLRKHRKSSSVLFTCPNDTDLNGREYKRLCKYLVETHFEGDFIVSIRKEIPTSTSNTNSKNKRTFCIFSIFLTILRRFPWILESFSFRSHTNKPFRSRAPRPQRRGRPPEASPRSAAAPAASSYRP